MGELDEWSTGRAVRLAAIQFAIRSAFSLLACLAAGGALYAIGTWIRSQADNAPVRINFGILVVLAAVFGYPQGAIMLRGMMHRTGLSYGTLAPVAYVLMICVYLGAYQLLLGLVPIGKPALFYLLGLMAIAAFIGGGITIAKDG